MHGGWEVPHDLLGNAVSVLRSLREGDARPEAGDQVVPPHAGFVGELVGRHAHGHPELGLVHVAGEQGKFKATGHDADDGVGTAIENDGAAEDVWVAIEAGKPEGVAEDGDGAWASSSC